MASLIFGLLNAFKNCLTTNFSFHFSVLNRDQILYIFFYVIWKKISVGTNTILMSFSANFDFEAQVMNLKQNNYIKCQKLEGYLLAIFRCPDKRQVTVKIASFIYTNIQTLQLTKVISDNRCDDSREGKVYVRFPMCCTHGALKVLIKSNLSRS